MKNQALARATTILGSATKLANKLGVSKATVSLWGRSATGVPIDQCAPIDRITNGQVTCEQLRPDYDFSRISPIPVKPAHTDRTMTDLSHLANHQ